VRKITIAPNVTNHYNFYSNVTESKMQTIKVVHTTRKNQDVKKSLSWSAGGEQRPPTSKNMADR